MNAWHDFLSWEQRREEMLHAAEVGRLARETRVNQDGRHRRASNPRRLFGLLRGPRPAS